MTGSEAGEDEEKRRMGQGWNDGALEVDDEEISEESDGNDER
jgi:hypothetical protein